MAYDREMVDFSDEDHAAAGALNQAIEAFSNDVKGDEMTAVISAVVTVLQRVASAPTKQERIQRMVKIAVANLLDEMPKVVAE